jgi:hypothetical protein
MTGAGGRFARRSPKDVCAVYKTGGGVALLSLRDTKVAFRNIARVDEQRNDKVRPKIPSCHEPQLP